MISNISCIELQEKDRKIDLLQNKLKRIKRHKVSTQLFILKGVQLFHE